MEKGTEKRKVSLRPAEEKDCALIWRWRNDESTRIWFGDTAPIPYQDHKKWFFNKLNSSDTQILIVLNEESKEIGQVRFHLISSRTAEIRVIIDPAERGKGYGSSAIKASCEYAFKELGVEEIIAYIKKENEPSIKAFIKAGFTNLGLKDFGMIRSIEMVLKREQE